MAREESTLCIPMIIYHWDKPFSISNKNMVEYTLKNAHTPNKEELEEDDG